jgi:hypothetical protein
MFSRAIDGFARHDQVPAMEEPDVIAIQRQSTTKLLPGRTTRKISNITRLGWSKWWTESRVTTASKLPFGKGVPLQCPRESSHWQVQHRRNAAPLSSAFPG